MAVIKYESKRKGKTVHVGWTVRNHFTGSRRFGKFPKTEKGRRDAESLDRKMKREYKSSVLNLSSYEMTVRDAIDDYINYLQRMKKPGLRTAVNNSRVVKNFGGRLLDTSAREIRKNEFRKILESIAEGRPNRKHYSGEITLLRAALNHFGETKTNDYTCVVGAKTIEEFGSSLNSDNVKALSPIELCEVARLMFTRYDFLEYALFVVQTIFGNRIGEARGYYLDDLKFDEGYLYRCGQIPSVSSSAKKKVFRLKRNGNLLDHSNCPRQSIKSFYLFAFLKDVELVSRDRQKCGKDPFLFVNRDGLPINYKTFSDHLKETGFYGERGLTSHKNRKTAKTLGELLLESRDGIDPTVKMLDHKPGQIETYYRDKDVLAKFSDIPGRLFNKYFLPVYRPSHEALDFAAQRLGILGLKSGFSEIVQKK